MEVGPHDLVGLRRLGHIEYVIAVPDVVRIHAHSPIQRRWDDLESGVRFGVRARVRTTIRVWIVDVRRLIR